MPSNFHKPVTSVISTRKETLTQTTVPSNVAGGFVWTLVDRQNLTADTTNYTTSFNLPFELANFSSASTLSLAYPELQQLNVRKFIIGVIEDTYYSEMIDGRSVTVTVPQTGTTKTLLSSTYNVLQKSEDNVFLGKNVAFLFCDAINLPFTGTTDGGSNSRADVESWSASSYLNRPAAVSYQNLQPIDINSDNRTSWKKAVNVPNVYPTNSNQGYNYDIPVGFVALDKGFVVITHPDIVLAMNWSAGTLGGGGSANSAGLTTNIGFASNSQVTFYDISIEYRTNVVTAALPGEFYFSNNPTWNYAHNLQEYQLGTNNYDDTYVTEIGMYNINDELIAVAKLDRAKQKGFTGLLTFNLQIDV